MNADVPEPLAPITTDGFLYVFMRGGEVIAYVYSLDKEGIGCLWGGKGDF